MQELDEISHWVRTQSVPRLVTGTEPPESVLPTRYEIAVGHQDEHRAMSTGSVDDFGCRSPQAERLGAASVRIDLVEVIGQMDGSPSDQQIAAWLAQLTDEEVLDRMSRLKRIHTYDPGVVHKVIR